MAAWKAFPKNCAAGSYTKQSCKKRIDKINLRLWTDIQYLFSEAREILIYKQTQEKKREREREGECNFGISTSQILIPIWHPDIRHLHPLTHLMAKRLVNMKLDQSMGSKTWVLRCFTFSTGTISHVLAEHSTKPTALPLLTFTQHLRLLSLYSLLECASLFFILTSAKYDFSSLSSLFW